MKSLHQFAFTIAGLGILIFAGPAAADSGYDNGKAAYETTCIACHGVSGKGEIPGVPNFTKKKGPLSKSDEALFLNILNGFQSPGSFMEMPARGGNPELTEQDIRDVIEYLREEFEKK